MGPCSEAYGERRADHAMSDGIQLLPHAPQLPRHGDGGDDDLLVEGFLLRRVCKCALALLLRSDSVGSLGLL